MSARVLVVDDEPHILRALKASLRGAGYEVDTADTAEGALTAAALAPPDAVILDLVLPDGRGRVNERVIDQRPGEGQTLAVEDPRIQGTQEVRFLPVEDGTEVRLELVYDLKQRNPLTPVIDLLFIRRAMRDSLRRTLTRFGRELAADRELLR